MSTLRLGIIFGSRSVEHEVSIITAMQLMKHVSPERYTIVPLYVDKTGKWWHASTRLEDYRSTSLPQSVFSPYTIVPDPTVDHGIDVAIICCHGTMGEDGTIQGLLELAGIPYQGPGVVGSAVCMDKIITKKTLQASQVPVVNYQWYTKQTWQADRSAVLQSITDPTAADSSRLMFPLFVKPANLGSSVGISKVNTVEELSEAIDVAFSFDQRVLIEQGLEGIKEINIAVLGDGEYQASVPEEPIASGELLSYADKYEGGGKKIGGMASLKRRIPAPIPQRLSTNLQEAAMKAAKECAVFGVVRVDCMVRPETGEYWINELNTIPGSLSFYLWEASGLPYSELIDRLVSIAQERFARTQTMIRSIPTTIL